VHRVDGVVLEGPDILLADYLVRQGVEYLQRRNGGAVPARALRLRDQLAAFAARETVAVVVSGPGETAKPAAAVIVEGSPARIGTHAAAAKLQVSTQAIRGMCRRGALAADRTPTGWRIEEWSVAEEAARRQEERE
jgi:hypothetical protein